MAVIELDTLVIGGGLTGIYMLYQLRKAGFKAKIVEAGASLGGVWWVDSDDQVWRTFY